MKNKYDKNIIDSANDHNDELYKLRITMTWEYMLIQMDSLINIYMGNPLWLINLNWAGCIRFYIYPRVLEINVIWTDVQKSRK